MDGIKRILIVDDSSTMRAILDAMLADQPEFEVVGLARGADEALSLVRTARPHLALIDLCMPQIDGSALLQMLAEDRGLSKVVLSTKVNLPKDVQRKLIEQGAAAIFDKNEIVADQKAFIDALRRVVDGDRAVAPAGDPPSMKSNVIVATDRFPMPEDEVARARTVRKLEIANLDADPRLNILVRHMARLSGFPIAAVNVIGTSELWVKAAVGIAPQSVPRRDSVCAHAICAEKMTVVSDLRQFPAFSNLPMVKGGLMLRAYVGAPIVARDGSRLGMACIMDTKPRIATLAERNIVAEVATLVATALETPLSPLQRVA